MIDQTKENLINSLVCKLSENTDLSMEELRDKIYIEMYSWNVSKLDEDDSKNVSVSINKMSDIGKGIMSKIFPTHKNCY